jgi:hypothetical protein
MEVRIHIVMFWVMRPCSLVHEIAKTQESCCVPQQSGIELNKLVPSFRIYGSCAMLLPACLHTITRNTSIAYVHSFREIIYPTNNNPYWTVLSVWISNCTMRVQLINYKQFISSSENNSHRGRHQRSRPLHNIKVHYQVRNNPSLFPIFCVRSSPSYSVSV